jgi:flagellar basal-body rod protein FlgB
MGDILGDAFGPLETQLHFRVARQAALAANLANADTPGYRRVDLRFDEALAAAGARLERSHPRHLAAGEGGGPYRVELGPPGTRPDRNGVDLDSELVQARRNAGQFEDMAGVLARIVALRRAAIGSGQ